MNEIHRAGVALRYGVRWILWLALGGCGRIAFDPLGALDDGGTNGDGGGPATSCVSLAPTCGPNANADCCTTVTIPGGTFSRSYDVAGDGMFGDPSHMATVSTFRLDTYLVTVGRFRRFVEAGAGIRTAPPAAGAGAHPNLPGSGWDASWNVDLSPSTAQLRVDLGCDPVFYTWTDAPAGSENRPITCLTWYEAAAFCIWDGGYLPTEAEWNYAAAGGNEQRAYPWSSPAGSLTLDNSYASYYVDAGSQCTGDGVAGCTAADITPVGSKPAGNARWGHADLGGNMWEWLLDYSNPTYVMPCVDCADLNPSLYRVIRAGSYVDMANRLRTGFRGDGQPGVGGTFAANSGVRCARVP